VIRASTDETTHGSVPADAGACVAQLDQLSETDMQAAVDQALATMKGEGVTPEEVWATPDRFVEFHAQAQRAAGCEPAKAASGKIAEPLHADRGPDNYCGPGHSTDLPQVSTCLNDACFHHDACYARCSAETSLTCMWGGPTTSCDDAMFAAADSCVHDSHKFASFVVISLAKLLSTNGPTFGCEVGMKCPGEGACDRDRTGSECLACLEHYDPQASCSARACEDSMDDVCYLANCPDIGRCFGRSELTSLPGDTGVGGAGGTSGDGEAGSPITGGAGGDTGASQLPIGSWSITLVRGEVPQTKPTGEAWDASPFEAPDPFVRVRIGAADAMPVETSSPEDTYFPVWSGDGPIAIAGAEEFATYLSVEMWDEDLSQHDLIGSCETQLSGNNFGGAVQRFDCLSAEGVLRFTVYYSMSSVGS
jgi:hypothetical protein